MNPTEKIINEESLRFFDKDDQIFILKFNLALAFEALEKIDSPMARTAIEGIRGTQEKPPLWMFCEKDRIIGMKELSNNNN